MVVVPYSTIEPIKAKLSSSFQTDNEMADSIWTQAMNEHIKNTKANVIVRLGEAEMTLGDLLTLEAGDIIPLNQDASGEVTVTVEGVDKMKCLMGTFKGNRAVQITSVNEVVVYEDTDQQ
jgi:flagellar motor switch protein FliM